MHLIDAFFIALGEQSVTVTGAEAVELVIQGFPARSRN